MHLCEWKVFFILIKISLKFAPKVPTIGLDNGLAGHRRWAVTWTNADPIHWRIYAALGGDELRASIAESVPMGFQHHVSGCGENEADWWALLYNNVPYIVYVLFACQTAGCLSLAVSFHYYHKISNIRCTESQNLNDSHLVLQLYLPDSLKLGVKSRMKT